MGQNTTPRDNCSVLRAENHALEAIKRGPPPGMWSNRTVQDGDGNRAIHQSRLTGRTRWVSRCTTGLAGPPRWNSNSMASACSLGVAMARRIHHCPFGARHRVQTATGGCMVSGSGPSSMAKVPPCVTRDCRARTACSRASSSKTY